MKEVLARNRELVQNSEHDITLVYSTLVYMRILCCTVTTSIPIPHKKEDNRLFGTPIPPNLIRNPLKIP